ncbi:PAS domain-containing protein, partial [Marinilabilia sp.]
MLESYKEENQKLLAEIKELKQKVAQLESGEGPYSNYFAENNKIFQQAQSIAKIGSWKVNLSTGEVNATPEAYDIYGIEKNRKITLKEIQKYPLPEYRSFLDKALKNLIERNIEYNVTFKIRRKSDKKIRVIQSIAEYNPKDHSIIGTIQDITQQKKSEQELLESEEKFRFLFKKHKAVQLIIDSETGDIADANEAAEKFYGWSIKTLKTKNISEINTLPKPVIKKLLKEVGHSHNMNLEFRHRKADNSACDITSASSAIELNGKKYIHSFIQDNTANKETEHKLKLLSRSVEQSPVLIIITNNTGRIEYVNPAFTDKTGYALNEVIDQTPAILKSGNQSEEFYRDLWGTILAGKNWSGQFLNKKKNGEFYWENAFISPILDNSGKITHFVAVKEDITEKRNANLELQEREANLKAIIENSIDSIWSINKDFKIQYLNEVFKE